MGEHRSGVRKGKGADGQVLKGGKKAKGKVARPHQCGGGKDAKGGSYRWSQGLCKGRQRDLRETLLWVVKANFSMGKSSLSGLDVLAKKH